MPDDWFDLSSDPAHAARERNKARELKKSAWWQRRTQPGVCFYCGKQVGMKALTLDHIVPVARGGRSTKGNVVPSCKDCNNKKKLATPAELLLMNEAASARGGGEDE